MGRTFTFTFYDDYDDDDVENYDEENGKFCRRIGRY